MEQFFYTAAFLSCHPFGKRYFHLCTGILKRPGSDGGKLLSFQDYRFQFFTAVKTFRSNVLHILAQSYSGKPAAAIKAASGINCKVTAIEKGAFKNFKKLKKATIGRNVETIGDSSFYGCAKLTGIDTRNAVKIGKSSFRKCTGLTGVTIGAKAAVIGDSSFYGCRRLTRVTLGKNVKIKDISNTGSC